MIYTIVYSDKLREDNLSNFKNHLICNNVRIIKEMFDYSCILVEASNNTFMQSVSKYNGILSVERSGIDKGFAKIDSEFIRY